MISEDRKLALLNAIDQYRYKFIIKELKSDILKEIESDEIEELAFKIFAMCDEKTGDLLIKKLDKITPAMVDLNFNNYNAANYVRRILLRYKKKLDLTSVENKNAFFRIACQTGSIKYVKSVMKQDLTGIDVSVMAAGNDDIFALLLDYPAPSLPEDKQIEIFVGAAMTKDGENRVKALIKEGFDLNAKLDNQTVITELEEAIASTQYGSNKRGSLKKKQDKALLDKMSGWVTNGLEIEKNKKSPAKLIIIIVALLLLAAVASGIAYATTSNSSSESVESTEE